MNPRPDIIISTLDARRLEALLHDLGDFPGADALAEELDRATLVAPEAMPARIVTMNSRVRFTVQETGLQREMTLVYPQDADTLHDKISVLAPVGMALLGVAEGASIDWPLPQGGSRRIRIDAVSDQPAG